MVIIWNQGRKAKENRILEGVRAHYWREDNFKEDICLLLYGGCRPPRIRKKSSKETKQDFKVARTMSTNSQDRDPDIELFVKVRQEELQHFLKVL